MRCCGFFLCSRNCPPRAARRAAARKPPNNHKNIIHHQIIVKSYGTGSWGTLSSLFFLFSALFDDLLLVRFCLMMAYVTLVINISLGIPDILNWGLAPKPVLLVGSIVLNSIALFLHVSVVVVVAVVFVVVVVFFFVGVCCCCAQSQRCVCLGGGA